MIVSLYWAGVRWSGLFCGFVGLSFLPSRRSSPAVKVDTVFSNRYTSISHKQQQGLWSVASCAQKCKFTNSIIANVYGYPPSGYTKLPDRCSETLLFAGGVYADVLELLTTAEGNILVSFVKKTICLHRTLSKVFDSSMKWKDTIPSYVCRPFRIPCHLLRQDNPSRAQPIQAKSQA